MCHACQRTCAFTAPHWSTPDGELWQPVRGQTRICSAHFVGNRKSTIANHPAYVPSIFPSCYGRGDGAFPESKLERFNRAQRRSQSLPAAATQAAGGSGKQISPKGSPCSCGDEPQAPMASSSASVVTQTDDFFVGPCTLFLSVTLQSSASTQVAHSDTVDCGIQVDSSKRSTSTGPDE
ncbi:uncharacterized protein LOC144106752 isoform X2 [Amblyomma americanum]